MTISFIFRERPDAEPVKISGKPGNIVKNAHRNKKKAVKTTFPKGFSSSGNKHFRRYFPRGAQKIPMTTVFMALKCAVPLHEDGRHDNEDGRHGKGLPASLRPGSLYVPYSCTISKQDPDIRLTGS